MNMNHSDVDRGFRTDAGMGFGTHSAMGSMTAADAPPIRQKFEAAVREFASWVSLDPEGMLKGETFMVSGVPVTLMHYGAGDPHGATVVIDYGEFTPETEAAVLRNLLEHNLVTPGARHGYFALGPGLNRILYCLRVDLEATDNGAAALGQTIGMAVESVRALCFAVVNQLDALQGKASTSKAQRA